jgi:hypothetical protein
MLHMHHHEAIQGLIVAPFFFQSTVVPVWLAIVFGTALGKKLLRSLARSESGVEGCFVPLFVERGVRRKKVGLCRTQRCGIDLHVNLLDRGNVALRLKNSRHRLPPSVSAKDQHDGRHCENDRC